MGSQCSQDEEAETLLKQYEYSQSSRNWRGIANGLRLNSFFLLSLTLNILLSCSAVFWNRAPWTSQISYERGFRSDLGKCNFAVPVRLRLSLVFRVSEVRDQTGKKEISVWSTH